MQRSTEVADALRAIYAAVSDGDEAALLESLSSAEGLLLIGTDPDEWLDDVASIRRMLKAQAEAGITVHPGSITAFEEGPVGWAADQGVFRSTDGSEVPFRMTSVFRREEGAWKLVQQHVSFAVPNEEALGVEL